MVVTCWQIFRVAKSNITPCRVVIFSLDFVGADHCAGMLAGVWWALAWQGVVVFVKIVQN